MNEQIKKNLYSVSQFPQNPITKTEHKYNNHETGKHLEEIESFQP